MQAREVSRASVPPSGIRGRNGRGLQGKCWPQARLRLVLVRSRRAGYFENSLGTPEEKSSD